MCDWKLFSGLHRVSWVSLLEVVVRAVWKGKRRGWIDVRNYISAGDGGGEIRGRIEVPFAIRYPSKIIDDILESSYYYISIFQCREVSYSCESFISVLSLFIAAYRPQLTRVGVGERTCRTDTDIRRRDQYPCVWREREAEVGDRGEAIGVEGGQTECWTPGVEFERHDWVGG